LKLIKKNSNGIGFALSASDLLTVLRRFYPTAKFPAPEETVSASAATTTENSAQVPAVSEASAHPSLTLQPPHPHRTGTGIIISDPDGAEIFVDEKFFGDTPATLKLSAGTHAIVLRIPGYFDWRRTLEVLKGNKSSLKATLDHVK